MQRTLRKAISTGAIVALSGLLIVGVSSVALDSRQATAESVASARDYTTPVVYEPPPQHDSVAFLGDSFTQGGGATTNADRWTTIVAREQGWIELNYGFGGTNYGTAGEQKGGKAYYNRLTDLVISDPDIVIVSSAGNFLSAGQEKGITRTFEDLREALPDAEIYATAPFHRAGEYPKAYSIFGVQIKDAVEAVGGKYLDIGHPLGEDINLMHEDDIHPNDAGHRLIADAIADELE